MRGLRHCTTGAPPGLQLRLSAHARPGRKLHTLLSTYAKGGWPAGGAVVPGQEAGATLLNELGRAARNATAPAAIRPGGPSPACGVASRPRPMTAACAACPHG